MIKMAAADIEVWDLREMFKNLEQRKASMAQGLGHRVWRTGTAP